MEKICKNCQFFKNGKHEIQGSIGSSTYKIEFQTAGEIKIKDEEGKSTKESQVVEFAICQNKDTTAIQMKRGDIHTKMDKHMDKREQETKDKSKEVLVYENDYCSNFKPR